MDWGILEALAESLYDELALDTCTPPSLFRLARTWLGVSVERPKSVVGALAATFRLGGRDRIVVKASVRIEYAHFYVGHELGHILLRRSGYDGEDEEACADYIGAALLMPRRAVVAMHNAHGFDPATIARRIVCTETAAALRLAEVTRVPLAAISPARVRVRGPDAFEWPDEATVRCWASGPAPGLTKLRLTDQPRRVALLAHENVA